MTPYFTKIKCQFGKGQFKTEYAVQLQDYELSWVSMFVDSHWVQHDEYTIHKDRDHEGWLTVRVVHEKDGLSLIRLPTESFEQGRYITVKTWQLLQSDR